jgi:hypothetical protein
MLAMLPDQRQAFGHALIAEQNEITDARERLRWAAGGMFMSMREFVAKLFDDPLAWALGSVFGVGAALLDLHSGTRRPYLIAVCAIAFLLTLFRPWWTWRWTLLAALVLPAFVLLSGDWGPYRVDQFDVFYGVLPAGLGTLGALGLRKAAHYHRHPPAKPDAAA